jgi:aminopeptidase-like protein
MQSVLQAEQEQVTALTRDVLDKLFDELFPIFRSITGPGYRQSMEVFRRYMPLEMEHVPSGTEVFDWTVPPEWRLHSARLTGPDGTLLADSGRSNLMVVNYSEAIDRHLSLEALLPHLHGAPALPEAIPYVTSYYKRRWGFCLPQAEIDRLPPGTYHAHIDAEFVPGSIDFGHCTLPGETETEIVLSSYLCHPSLANNELSGPLALLFLYGRIAQWPRRRFTYRFILNPETIGSICYLHRHGEQLRRKMAAGLVLTCLGGPCERLSYQLSRRGDSLLDLTAVAVAGEGGTPLDIRVFDPADGSDERQYCSPGFNLPMGQMARTVYGRYPEYHTSFDDKAFMNIDVVYRSAEQIETILRRAEISGAYRNLKPFCEPQLSKANLMPSINSPGTKDSDERRASRRIMTILNFSDGVTTMIEIAKRCGCTVAELEPSIAELERAGLLTLA